MIDLGPYYAGMRYAIATGGAVAATLGIISSVDAASLTAALNDIGDGVKLIMKGGGTIMVIVAPVWGIVRSKLSSKTADVKAADPAALAVAMTKVAPSEQVAAVSAMPEVKAMSISDPALASAAKIADPSTAVTMVKS